MIIDLRVETFVDKCPCVSRKQLAYSLLSLIKFIKNCDLRIFFIIFVH